jgi:hypothetical protein
MGHSSDRLAAKFNVSRADQDEFTVLSHTRAAAAHANGMYKVGCWFILSPPPHTHFLTLLLTLLLTLFQ